MEITADQIIAFVERVAASIKAERDYLTQLDAAIGDADHGLNLDRGFSVVITKLPAVADKDIGSILKTVGMTLVSTVGGASGPLYGTAFLRAGMVIGDRQTIGTINLIGAFESALEGIQSRGKSTRGEKTMIDAIAPGIEAFKAAHFNGVDLLGALEQGLVACEEGMQATIPMLATKGRASYLGERSIGHQDPGATSAYLIAKALVETVRR
ncbi:dihydroxyacetone kinase subunit DhaL [Candidatus Oscillochloris fontis]|uniref:dihydroxyacetone kinase subunit DhaL n=1 Tax=Candidatus Oscillochloris fontis TaxID=2496868 RepID=UPI00101D8822|nr:dihydroxyacetone kinase subunit DhaL [Candidatus Oscillochloris fontis]